MVHSINRALLAIGGGLMIPIVDHYTRPVPSLVEDVRMTASRLGYVAIGVDSEALRGYTPANRRGTRIIPVDFIEAREEYVAKRLLKGLRGNRLVIARATGPGAFRFFSRDGRARIVELTPRLTRLFDKDEASLLRQGRTIIGINLSILQKGSSMLPWIQALLAKSFKYGIRVVIYSGSRDPRGLWHPRSIYSLVKTMGFPFSYSLSLLSGDVLLGGDG